MNRYVRGISCKPVFYVSWSISEIRVRLALSETTLSTPVKYFTDRSKAVLLLRIIYVISVLFLLCFCARLSIDALTSPAGKVLSLWCLIVKLSLSHWYPGSGMVLDFIDSCSMSIFFSIRVRVHLLLLSSWIRNYFGPPPHTHTHTRKKNTRQIYSGYSNFLEWICHLFHRAKRKMHISWVAKPEWRHTRSHITSY